MVNFVFEFCGKIIFGKKEFDKVTIKERSVCKKVFIVTGVVNQLINSSGVVSRWSDFGVFA